MASAEGASASHPPGANASLRGDQIDAARSGRHWACPSSIADGGAWVLGRPAADRLEALRSLEAPDFSLPYRTGRRHSLSEHRGKKWLLVSWALV